jgi:hypothetical protein
MLPKALALPMFIKVIGKSFMEIYAIYAFFDGTFYIKICLARKPWLAAL